MARKSLIRSDQHFYHVTTRSNNRERFVLPLNQVWEICLASLEKAYNKHKVEVTSFVLMNNHYHILIRTPNSNLDEFMYELNKNISLELRVKSNQMNRMFGGRYKWCLIRSERYFKNCYRYVYQNPLRAGLVINAKNIPTAL